MGIRAGSPTWPLERAGWYGVLVEPLPDVAAFLVTARTAKVFAAACVAPDVAGQPLALRVASPLASINVGQPVGAPPPSYVVTVPTRTLDDILREAEAPTPLDLIVLDVYGHELDALLGFDFGRWRPRLIVIADPIVNLTPHRFPKESGYRLIRRVNGRGGRAGERARCKRPLGNLARLLSFAAVPVCLARATPAQCAHYGGSGLSCGRLRAHACQNHLEHSRLRSYSERPMSSRPRGSRD